MADEISLGDILDEKSDAAIAPPEQKEAPPAEAPEQVERATSRRQAHQDKEMAARGMVRDPATGQFAKPPEAEPEKHTAEPEKPKEAQAAAPQQQEMTAKEKAFLAQATDERRKRQELEQRLAALEKNQSQEPKKGFWDDPEAALAAQRAETQQMVLSTRLNTAEAIAREKHPDFDEKMEAFKAFVESNPAIGPSLVQQCIGSANPAQFAYNFAKQQKELAELGGMEAYKQKTRAEVEAEVRAKVEAEYKAKAEADAKLRAGLPRSLGDARGVAPNKVVWSGPPSLEDILKP